MEQQVNFFFSSLIFSMVPEIIPFNRKMISKSKKLKMFLGESERFYQRKEIDTRKLMFEYYWVDLQEAREIFKSKTIF